MSTKPETRNTQHDIYEDIIPYPGLRPFTHSDAPFFWGREKQTEVILRQLVQSRFVALIGPSGCGKTSLLLAGMAASLKAGQYAAPDTAWWISLMRPGEHPIPSLAEALQQSVLEEHEGKPGAEQAVLNQMVLSHLRHAPSGLVKVLQEGPFPENIRVLLVVDQFEDIFRFENHKSREEMKAFVALLIESVRQSEFPIYVVLAVRSKYLQRCIEFRDLPETMSGNQVLVPLLTPGQIRKTIIEPARQCHGTVDTDVVNTFLHEMEARPARLPLLQHCLRRTWLRAYSRAQDIRQTQPIFTPSYQSPRVRVTLDDYTSVGGLKHALSNHADETFQMLDEDQQQIARHLFCRFADRRSEKRSINTLARVREIASIAQATPSAVIEVIEVFRHPEHGFLMPEAGTPLHADSIISVSHESLLQHWRRLAEWIEQEFRSASLYRHLEQSAQLWQQGKASLWRSPELEQTLEWRAREHPTAGWAQRYGHDFELAMAFLDASERKQSRKRHGLFCLLLGLLLLSGIAVWGMWEHVQRMYPAAQSGIASSLSLFQDDTASELAAVPTSTPPLTPIPTSTPPPVPTATSEPTRPPAAAITAAQTPASKPLKPPAIRWTFLRHERFYVKAGESVVLAVEMEEPSPIPVLVECQAIKGDVECSDIEGNMALLRYTAPVTSGKDLIEVHLENSRTGETAHTLIKLELLQ